MNECTELHLQMKKAKLTEDIWLMDSPKLVRGSLERLYFFHTLWDSNPGLSDCKAPKFLIGLFSGLYVWAS